VIAPNARVDPGAKVIVVASGPLTNIALFVSVPAHLRRS